MTTPVDMVAPQDRTRRLDRVTLGCFAAALVLLVWSVALAVWSQLGHADATIDSYPPKYFPGPYPTIVLAVAGGLAVALIVATLIRRVSQWVVVLAALLAVVAAGFLLVRAPGAFADAHTALTSLVRNGHFMTAAAAWTLATLGAVTALVGVGALASEQVFSRRPIAIGATVAVVLSIALTVMAFHLGDDTRFIDSTTAATAATPPVPNIVGEQRFSVKISDQTNRVADEPDYRVAVAGNGFVVSQKHQITAYDSTGHERWHYRRTGPGDVAIWDFQVYDEGKTVIIRLDGSHYDGHTWPLIALDAVTGATLWSATDADLSAAYASPRGMTDPVIPRFLIARGDDHWEAFEPRTAKMLWRNAIPSTCSGDDFDSPIRDTAKWVVAFRLCVIGESISAEVRSVNPRTGKVTAQQQVVEPITPQHGPQYFDILATTASADSVAFLTTMDDPREWPRRLFDAASGATVDLPDVTQVWTADDPAGEFLADLRGPDYDHTPVALYGPNGKERCRFPGVSHVGSDRYDADLSTTAILGGQIAIWHYVRIDRPTPQRALQVFDRASCGLVGDIPVQDDSDVSRIFAAPGATLVVRADDSGTYVDGYA
jgi:outer membrane protein assembly factor BamB